MNKLYKLLPAIIFITIIVLLVAKIALPTSSNITHRKLPKFNSENLSPDDFKGKVTVVSFYASWCTSCLAQHSQLMDLKKYGALIYGINWKDKKKKSDEWLEGHGNPYNKITEDIDGKLGVEFGITGIPETMIINKEGYIIYHLHEPITEEEMSKIKSFL